MLLEIQGRASLLQAARICNHSFAGIYIIQPHNTVKLNPEHLVGESVDLEPDTSSSCLPSLGHSAPWFGRLGLPSLVGKMGITIKTFWNYDED